MERDSKKAETARQVLSRHLRDFTPRVLFAYLFGSSATEGLCAGRDVDLAVYFDRKRLSPEEAATARASLYAHLSRKLGRNDIDLVILNTARNLLLVDRITRDGIVLVDRDRDRRFDFEVAVQHRAMDFKAQRRSILGF
ncbi:MAG: nucleotidyltransferase-related protein [Desulfacinum sp.]|jgi:predicted nucleotidyltransferase|nr:nucleotidyltransferase-related protein [Desulfacinum sp.]